MLNYSELTELAVLRKHIRRVGAFALIAAGSSLATLALVVWRML